MAGNPNWTKGVSGNPGGRPKVVAEVRELAREHTQDAIKTLVDIRGDENAHNSARVATADGHPIALRPRPTAGLLRGTQLA